MPTTKPAAELTVNASGVRPRRPGRSPAECTSWACTSRSTTADTVGLEMLVRSAISGRVIGPSRKIVSRIACSLSFPEQVRVAGSPAVRARSVSGEGGYLFRLA